MKGDFFPKATREIRAIIKSSQNLQVVGLPGSGRTLLLRSLAKQYDYSYFDCSLIIDRTMMINQLKALIDQRLAKNQKAVIILDSFDFLSGSNLTDFYNLLFGLRNIKRNLVQYVFSTNREMTANLGSLGIILTENIYYLPPFDQKEALLFILQLEKNYNQSLTRTQKKQIFTLSGGFPRLIKLLVKIALAEQNLAVIKKDPSLNIHLKYYLEQTLEALSLEKETLKNLINEKTSPEDQKNLKTLQKYFIIDTKHQFQQPLLETFLKIKFVQSPEIKEKLSSEIQLTCQLTANEHKALKFLSINPNQICRREELIRAVWGPKSLEVAEHALDQLVHRLKKKLSANQPPLKLETIRGRGHRLII